MRQIKPSSSSNAGSLPADRAFVVQFGAVTADGKMTLQGRIEHLASAQAEYFSSEEELLRIFKKLLPPA